MKIITKELEKRFDQVGRQDEEVDPRVIARFFNAFGNGVWLATEYDPVSETCFGYVQLFEKEWGYFSLREMIDVKHPQLGIPMIERDLYFTEKPVSEICPELQESIKRQKELKEMEQRKDMSDSHELER